MTYVLLALLITPIVEIAVFIQTGEIIGLWPTLGVVVLTAFLGTALLRQQGMATMRATQQSMNRGEMPMDHIIDGICLLAAGILLLTPGFVTDAVGFLLFVPPFRRGLARAMIARMMASGNFHVYRGNFGTQTVVDGDFEDLTENSDETSRQQPTYEEIEELSRETDSQKTNPNSPWSGAKGADGSSSR